MNHLCYEEKFDIFVSDYIPTDKTPRIQVQLRTLGLVRDGLFETIEASYHILCNILYSYGIEIYELFENRIDYAFHTNLIQNPELFFSQVHLNQHLVTAFKDLWDHFYLNHRKEHFFELDYLALGSRKSNNVYFRIYDKTKEVIEKKYKSFFFDKWFQRGLISQYDKYVYEKAYKFGSYKTGCLVGMLEWYIEFGSNEEFKSKCRKLRLQCHVMSDNNSFIEKEIKGILPPPTKILNVEFETKRKFYRKLDGFMDCFEYKHKGYKDLKRLYKILALRREIIEKLTTDVVSFTKDRLDVEAPEMKWWYRLRHTKIDGQPDGEVIKAFYTYSRKCDLERAKRSFSYSLAGLAIISRNDTSESGISDDVFEALTLVNDNDKAEFERKTFEGLKNVSYSDIRHRKARRLRGVLKKDTDKAIEKIPLPARIKYTETEEIDVSELIFDDNNEVNGNEISLDKSK